MKDKALKLALEALEMFCEHGAILRPIETRDAIKQALEQPEPEPVAWRELLREARDNCKASIVEEGISASRKEYRIDLEARLTAALNTSPPKRKPLTDEEIGKIAIKAGCDPDRDDGALVISLARAIEAAHGIKGEA